MKDLYCSLRRTSLPVKWTTTAIGLFSELLLVRDFSLEEESRAGRWDTVGTSSTAGENLLVIVRGDISV
jgi:hypothetical protein